MTTKTELLQRALELCEDIKCLPDYGKFLGNYDSLRQMVATMQTPRANAAIAKALRLKLKPYTTSLDAQKALYVEGWYLDYLSYNKLFDTWQCILVSEHKKDEYNRPLVVTAKGQTRQLAELKAWIKVHIEENKDE